MRTSIHMLATANLSPSCTHIMSMIGLNVKRAWGELEQAPLGDFLHHKPDSWTGSSRTPISSENKLFKY